MSCNTPAPSVPHPYSPRYYHEKMQAPPGQQDAIIREIVGAYVEGLCWVMRYYYEGVASWEW